MTTDIDLHRTLGIETGLAAWKKRALWFGPIVLLLVVVGIWLTAHRSAAAKATQHFRTEEARMGDLTVTVTATGQLKPTHTVDVGSQVSGITDSVLVDYNDHVKNGQVLAKIKTDKRDAQVLQDKAQLASARASVDNAKVTVIETEAEYKRDLDARQRSKFQIVSQHDVDTAKAAYDRAVVAVTTAQASVTQAEANLTIDETNVNFAVIKSPVDGIVLSRSIEPGQTIAASFSVTTLFEIPHCVRTSITATATITFQSIPHALLVSNHALRFLPSAGNTEGSSTSFFPAPPGSNQTANAESSAALNNPRVWVARDGRPTPISVTVGATDGKVTEIRSDQVTPGMPLIVEVLKEGK